MSNIEKLKKYVSEHYTSPHRNGYIEFYGYANEEMQNVLTKYNLPACVFNGISDKSFVQACDVDENGNINIELINGQYVRQNKHLDFVTQHDFVKVTPSNKDYTIARTSIKNSEFRDGIIEVGAYNTTISTQDWGSISELKILNHQQIEGKIKPKARCIKQEFLQHTSSEVSTLLNNNLDTYDTYEARYRDTDGYVTYNEYKIGEQSIGALVPSDEVYRRTAIKLEPGTTFKEAIDFSLVGLRYREKSNELC